MGFVEIEMDLDEEFVSPQLNHDVFVARWSIILTIIEDGYISIALCDMTLLDIDSFAVRA